MTRREALALIGLLALAAPARARGDTDPQAARALVEGLAARAYAALAAPELSAAERRARLRAEIVAAFALEVWRRFLLGEAEARLTAAERAEIDALLPDYLAALYARRFEGAEAPTVGEPRLARGDALVPAKMPRPGRNPLPVEYRVRDIAGEGPRVIDVLVNGVSFLLLEREEFGAALARGGPAALIENLRRKAS